MQCVTALPSRYREIEHESVSHKSWNIQSERENEGIPSLYMSSLSVDPPEDSVDPVSSDKISEEPDMEILPDPLSSVSDVSESDSSSVEEPSSCMLPMTFLRRRGAGSHDCV